ncbi:uncharacterized protein [Euwallacea fornicatus]|uniref:uncharacterized protein n=1 Tax=Euwallacea fornicatus TaxID=995702 RepID=UPI00338EADE8
MDFSKFIYIALFLFTIAAVVSSAPQHAYRTNEFRNKREQHGNRGITGPIFSFVKTDKNANFKWGVRHHLGRHNAGNS